MTGTLTLNPAGDQALDCSTGSIYKGGTLFVHTKGGADNTALGQEALVNVTTGVGNTASGFRALFYNTTGPNKHGQRGPSALFQPERFQYGQWLLRAQRRPIRGSQHGLRIRGTQEQSHEFQHCQRRSGAVRQHERIPQHGQRCSGALLQHDR